MVSRVITITKRKVRVADNLKEKKREQKKLYISKEDDDVLLG